MSVRVISLYFVILSAFSCILTANSGAMSLEGFEYLVFMDEAPVFLLF